jgi:hypothetical protein
MGRSLAASVNVVAPYVLMATMQPPGRTIVLSSGMHRSGTTDLAEGHRTPVWLASAPADEIEPRTGGYWHHRAPREPHPAARDVDFQRRLLQHLEGLTGLQLPAGGSR